MLMGLACIHCLLRCVGRRAESAVQCECDELVCVCVCVCVRVGVLARSPLLVPLAMDGCGIVQARASEGESWVAAAQ